MSMKHGPVQTGGQDNWTASLEILTCQTCTSTDRKRWLLDCFTKDFNLSNIEVETRELACGIG